MPAGAASTNCRTATRKCCSTFCRAPPWRGPAASALDQKIGDFFASCMDTATINQRGIAPLKPELDRIDAMARHAGRGGRDSSRLHRMGVGVLFTFGAQPDAKDSNQDHRRAGPGRPLAAGSRLLSEDRPEVRRDPPALLQHVTKMFELAGDPAEGGRRQGAGWCWISKPILAKASADRVSMRDPNKRYHIMTKKELAELAPTFPGTTTFRASARRRSKP